MYKDPNHKPELAIALTKFTALVGFRPHDELYEYLRQLQPIVSLLGIERIEGIRTEGAAALKECFAILMHLPQDRVDQCVGQLTVIFEAEGK